MSLPSSPELPLQGGQSAVQQSQPDFRIASNQVFVKVPFDFYANSILIQARINNSKPIWLAVDTGLNVDILNERLFTSVEPKSDRGVNVIGGGGSVQGHLVENASISLPGLEVNKQTIASAPLDAMKLIGRDVEGLLGTPFLKNFVVEIDYEHQTLTMFDPRAHSLATDSDAINMESRNGWPYVQAELSLSERDRITGQFMFDTGSNRTFTINRPFAETHRLLSILPKSKTTEGLGEGIGGRTRFVEGRIRSIRIGKHIIHRPVISISQDTQGFGVSADAGSIDAGILSRFTVTLDYPSSRILLQPNSRFNEPYEIDMSGLELVTKPDDYHAFVINTVMSGYPAANAGLLQGDQILNVNSRPAANFELDQLIKMFRQPGRTYLLTIKRGNRTFKVRLKMKRTI